MNAAVLGDRREVLGTSSLPLLERFPALGKLPRASLGTFPSPVERIDISGVRDGGGGKLWVKRDDLNAGAYGGNKVRALEFLLGGLRAGDEVLTIGGEGSTHVLTAAAHARTLGVGVRAVRWRHEMSPVALAVGRRAAELCRAESSHGIVAALGAILVARLRGGARWIPLGGTSPLGILGHVNAALELARQIAAGELPHPARVVVPLGTGGTAAGLALGFGIAGLDTVVLGVRVGPRIAANARRVRMLARNTAKLIEIITGERIPPLVAKRLEVSHEFFGGAYGRPLTAAATSEGEAQLRRTAGVTLDATYSAKAFAAALAMARRDDRVTLYWLTFDARWMTVAEPAALATRP